MTFTENDHPRNTDGTFRDKETEGNYGELPVATQKEDFNATLSRLENEEELTEQDREVIFDSHDPDLLQSCMNVAGSRYQGMVLKQYASCKNLSDNQRSEIMNLMNDDDSLDQYDRRQAACAYASNPTIPDSDLEEMARNWHAEGLVEQSVISNPNASDKTLAEAVKSMGPKPMMEALEAPGCGQKTVDAVLNKHKEWWNDYHLRGDDLAEKAWSNPHISPDRLENWKTDVSVSEDMYSSVAAGVALNPSITPGTAKEIAAMKDEYVSANLASNPSTPDNLLDHLAEQDGNAFGSYDVSMSMLTNPHIGDRRASAILDRWNGDPLCVRTIANSNYVSEEVRNKARGLYDSEAFNEQYPF